MINFKTLMASVLLAGMATQATFAQESGEKKKADYPYVFVGVQGLPTTMPKSSSHLLAL